MTDYNPRGSSRPQLSFTDSSHGAGRSYTIPTLPSRPLVPADGSYFASSVGQALHRDGGSFYGSPIPTGTGTFPGYYPVDAKYHVEQTHFYPTETSGPPYARRNSSQRTGPSTKQTSHRRLSHASVNTADHAGIGRTRRGSHVPPSAPSSQTPSILLPKENSVPDVWPHISHWGPTKRKAKPHPQPGMALDPSTKLTVDNRYRGVDLTYEPSGKKVPEGVTWRYYVPVAFDNYSRQDWTNDFIRHPFYGVEQTVLRDYGNLTGQEQVSLLDDMEARASKYYDDNVSPSLTSKQSQSTSRTDGQSSDERQLIQLNLPTTVTGLDNPWVQTWRLPPVIPHGEVPRWKKWIIDGDYPNNISTTVRGIARTSSKTGAAKAVKEEVTRQIDGFFQNELIQSAKVTISHHEKFATPEGFITTLEPAWSGMQTKEEWTKSLYTEAERQMDEQCVSLSEEDREHILGDLRQQCEDSYQTVYLGKANKGGHIDSDLMQTAGVSTS